MQHRVSTATVALGCPCCPVTSMASEPPRRLTKTDRFRWWGWTCDSEQNNENKLRLPMQLPMAFVWLEQTMLQIAGDGGAVWYRVAPG